MPGSAIIFGLMACDSYRVLEESKPRSATYDAEVCIGMDSTQQPVSSTALLHYFLRADEKPETKRNVYMVVGRIAGITPNTRVGEGRQPSEYDMEIQALSVSNSNLFLMLLNNLILIYYRWMSCLLIFKL
jgi:hypothetical protein